MEGYKDSSSDKDTMSAKGLKTSGDREDIENLIQVNGGTFILNTADDAIHSDTNASITGGHLPLQNCASESVTDYQTLSDAYTVRS